MDRLVDALSEPQKECLRLFYRRYDAKEIARQLGISPATVHQRLTSARRKLGVSRSMEAARLLAEAEGAVTYESALYEAVSVDGEGQSIASSWLSQLPWPLPTRGRRRNDRSFTEKLVSVFALAILFMIATSIYLIAIKAFSETL